MERIIVTVPKDKNSKWKVSVPGSSGKHRFSASTAYLLVEGYLDIKRKGDLVPKLKEKTVVRVNYGNGYHNQSLASTNPIYLLFALACFLEDYLSEDVARIKYANYENWEEIGL